MISESIVKWYCIFNKIIHPRRFSCYILLPSFVVFADSFAISHPLLVVSLVFLHSSFHFLPLVRDASNAHPIVATTVPVWSRSMKRWWRNCLPSPVRARNIQCLDQLISQLLFFVRTISCRYIPWWRVSACVKWFFHLVHCTDRVSSQSDVKCRGYTTIAFGRITIYVQKQNALPSFDLKDELTDEKTVACCDTVPHGALNFINDAS